MNHGLDKIHNDDFIIIRTQMHPSSMDDYV